MDGVERLRSALGRGVLVCDGGTGTELQALGLAPGAGGEAWNLSAPEKVRLVHQRYLEAGADLLTTNTFGGTPLALAGHGLGENAAEVNRAGARLAREVAGERAFVLGDVGPCGGLLEPYGDVAAARASDSFRLQAEALLEGGADAILVETMSDPVEAALAVRAAREAGARLVLATFAFQRGPDGFRTMMGADVAGAVEAVLAAGAEVVGANCGTSLSLDDYLHLTAELHAVAGSAPVLVQPNAGSPALEEGRAVYRTGPEAFAAAAPRLAAAGARIVGGCCGTAPAHIAAIKAALARQDARLF
jgi:5-methyltetrahydrofolate--homocysteine methyltransferase